jgi:large subunit ribosomal protein L15
MKYNELVISKHKSAKRVGRGIAAGQGKTAGRGTKGQNARTGARRKPGFEGGQNPLMQRLPKLRGFRSYKSPVEVVYTGQLDALKAKTIDNFLLAEAGLTSSPYEKVKILVKGELNKAVAVKLQVASENASAAIQKAGGSFEAVTRVRRTATEQTEKKQKK